MVASAIWSFFKKSTTSANLNQCLTCLIEVDCSQNSTAMVKHLEEAHPDQHEAFKKSSGIDAKDIKKPSAIWKHFRSTGDPKKHKCVVSFCIKNFVKLAIFCHSCAPIFNDYVTKIEQIEARPKKKNEEINPTYFNFSFNPSFHRNHLNSVYFLDGSR